MKTSILKYVLLACATASCLPALAANLPDYYPTAFDRWGVIDRVDLDNHILVVNDRSVHISRDLRVYTANTRFALARSLQPGMKIGFGTTGTRTAGGAVTEVWVLPGDYTPTQGGSTPVQERRMRRD